MRDLRTLQLGEDDALSAAVPTAARAIKDALVALLDDVTAYLTAYLDVAFFDPGGPA